MAATQNVVAAIKGGPVALLAAFGAIAVCVIVIALLVRSGRDDTSLENAPHVGEA